MPGRAPEWPAVPQKVRGKSLTEKGAVRDYGDTGLCAHIPCAAKAFSWLWQNESRFMVRNVSAGGAQGVFCRSVPKAECEKQYDRLSYVSEAMRQSWTLGRGDCHARYPVSSLCFMLRNPQPLGRELYLILKLYERCCRNEVLSTDCSHKGLGIMTV